MNKSLLLLLILLNSCTLFFKKKTERMLARVGSEYLFESDLKGIIPAGSLPKDSLILTKSFIDNWVQQKLMIKQALNNLSNEQMDFTKQLEDYKNSLIIYQYENALVKQKLDTVITDEEARNYYDTNQQNFQLKDNIVQLQYVKLPLKSSISRQVKKLLISENQDDKNKLVELCEKNAVDSFLDDQIWLYFNDVLKQIPIRTFNQEELLKSHRDIEVQDSLFLYMVHFKDFRIKESLSPFSLEKQRIRDIILNKRKIELIGRMQEDIYSKALKNNDFEIY
ncbi:MAG: hypothetical protein M0Q38_08390 [Bacteroidales bacterium]|nr:hypothetical protein [Bacteroidales bacterium]